MYTKLNVHEQGCVMLLTVFVNSKMRFPMHCIVCSKET
jgi:hypothetical protein